MEESTSTYVLHTNFIQQVICGLCQALTSLWEFHKLIIAIDGQVYDPIERPADIRPCFFQLLNCTWVPIWTLSIWRMNFFFQNIMNNNNSTNLPISASPIIREPIKWSWQNTVKGHAVMIGHILLHTTSVVTWSIIGTCEVTRNLNPSNNNSKMHVVPLTNSSVELSGVSMDIHLLLNKFTLESLLKILFYFYFSMVAVSIMSTVCITLLTFQHISIEFSRSLKNETDEDELAEFFNFVKIVVQNLNNATSSINFLAVIDGIQYYSRLVIILFGCRNWFLISLEILWFIIPAVELKIAAESHLRINQYKEWIIYRASQNKLNNFQSKCKLLLEYIHTSNEPVAIRAGHLFYITYGSVGTGLGLLATYTIITLQLGTSP